MTPFPESTIVSAPAALAKPDPGRGWRVVLLELATIVVATIGGGAFGTLGGIPGVAIGAFLGALVAGSAVAASRAGHRYGWSTEPHPVTSR